MWYWTPVWNTASISGDSRPRRPCAPNAPSATARNAATAPTSRKVLSIANHSSPRPSIALENVTTVAIVDDMLPAATFHILLALADEDRHGYAIIQDIAARTNGELKLSAGTLYRSIQRMLEQGLIVETRDRPAPQDDDERRRYYRITADGAAVAKAEARRLGQLVKMARAAGFAPGRM